MRIRWMVVFLVASLLLVSGCSLLVRADKLAIGKYVMQDTEHEDWAWVVLAEDNRFEFNRSMATSHRPSGTYTIEKGFLTLTGYADEVYIFKIDGTTLIFESGERAESLVPKGAKFVLSKDK